MPELDFMILVDYGLSVGLLCGLFVPFAEIGRAHV